MRERGSILFVCVENAGRSQIAEGFAKKYGLSATSAGTVPSPKVNPIVVQVMKENGIDISSNKPKMLTAQMIKSASLVVTMGCSVEEVCPKTYVCSDAEETDRLAPRRSERKTHRGNEENKGRD
jgi:protein-tyrosine-phosphatase